jgi:hypothetical protein
MCRKNLILSPGNLLPCDEMKLKGMVSRCVLVFQKQFQYLSLQPSKQSGNATCPSAQHPAILS